MPWYKDPICVFLVVVFGIPAVALMFTIAAMAILACVQMWEQMV